jgi:hypothetical protein
MADDRHLRLIATMPCQQYQCEAKFYIDEAHPSGQPHLIVHYGEGYSGRDDLPVVDGCPEFAAAIPVDWTVNDVTDLLLRPRPTLQGRSWPAWEIPTRDYGSTTLYRWWAGEKPE